MTYARTRQSTAKAGFTMIELLVVVALIAILSAIAIPAVASYIRNYRVRGATQQVAGELQRARMTAVKKNVNLGVLFLVTGQSTFRFVVEDAAGGGTPRPVVDAAFLNANPDRVFPEQELPRGVRFASTAAECPAAPGFGANDWAIRFTRLGGACEPMGGGEPCPDVLPAPGQPRIMFTGAGATVCVTEITTGLSRVITIAPSGQVTDQR